MDCSLPGSSTHGISQGKILGSVAISFCRGSSPPTDQTDISCIAGRFFTTQDAWEAQVRVPFHKMYITKNAIFLQIKLTFDTQPMFKLSELHQIKCKILPFLFYSQESNHLILCCPLLLLPSIFPSISVFSNESVLRMRWPKYWSFSFNISPSSEYSGLISFRMDWLDLLAVQGTCTSLISHHSSRASVPQDSAFFIVQLSHPYMTTG